MEVDRQRFIDFRQSIHYNTRLYCQHQVYTPMLPVWETSDQYEYEKTHLHPGGITLSNNINILKKN